MKDRKPTIFESENVIRTFVYEHWPISEIKEHTNSRGVWLQVPSPYKVDDKLKRLGFNVKNGHTVDLSAGISTSFLNFVAKFKGHKNKNSAKFYLAKLLRERKIDITSLKKSNIIVSKQIYLKPMPLPSGSFPLTFNGEGIQPTQALEYVKSRGLAENDLILYEINYCISGQYNGRILFPVRDKGEIVYFQSRTIRQDLVESKTIPKSLNPPFDGKEQVVYGLENVVTYWHLNQTPKEDKIIIVTEGPFDAVCCIGCSTFGSSMSDTQLNKILSVGASEIILAYDMDMAGVKATIKMVNKFHNKIPFRVAIYETNDVGDLAKELDRKTLRDKIINEAVPWGIGAKAMLVKRAMQENKNGQ